MNDSILNSSNVAAPAVAQPAKQQVFVLPQNDQDHLRMLAIFQYIYAGFTGLGALFTLLYAGMGTFIVFGGLDDVNQGGGAPPQAVGWMFMGLGVVGTALILLITALTIVVAMSLQNGKRRTLIFVVSIIQCLNVPIGTVLGVFTILALNRPAIKAFFDSRN